MLCSATVTSRASAGKEANKHEIDLSRARLRNAEMLYGVPDGPVPVPFVSKPEGPVFVTDESPGDVPRC